MKKISLAILASSMIFLSGCGSKINIDTSPVVIKVNNTNITKKMIDDSFQKGSLATNNVDDKNPQNEFIQLIYKNKIVNDLIVKTLIKDEAQKRNITVNDGEVNAKIQEIADKVGGKAKFEATLALNKLDKDSFKDVIKDDMLKEKVVASLSGSVTVSDKQAEDFYKSNQDTYFKHPDLVRASHILIGASATEIKSRLESATGGKKLSAAEMDKQVKAELAAAKVKADKILVKVKANPDMFAELARKNSQDTVSAQKGGDLGFFPEKEMIPAFSKVAFSTKPGEIHKNLVKTEFGYHIIKVSDRKKAGNTPLDEVKEQIKKYLSEQNKMQTLQKLIESSKTSAKIVYLDKEYNPDNIQTEIRKHMKAAQTKGQMPQMHKPLAVKNAKKHEKK